MLVLYERLTILVSFTLEHKIHHFYYSFSKLIYNESRSHITQTSWESKSLEEKSYAYFAIRFSLSRSTTLFSAFPNRNLRNALEMSNICIPHSVPSHNCIPHLILPSGHIHYAIEWRLLKCSEKYAQVLAKDFFGC